MVRFLVFLLLLVPSLALAQAEFSTIISPTTFSTSPTGPSPVTQSSQTSPWQVNVGNGITITGTVSTSPTGSTPITGNVGITGETNVNINQVNSNAISNAIPVSAFISNVPAVTVNGTVSTSPTGSTPVTQTTSPWQVNVGNGITIVGTVTTSLPGTNLVSPSIPNWPVNINQVNSQPISNAIPVSAFISNVPAVTVNGTVTTTGNTPVAISGTVTTTGNTPVAISGTVTVSTASATVSTSPTGPTPVTQSSQTSPWQVNVGNTVTVSTASATQPVSQTQIVPTSEKGMGYLDRLNFVAGSAVTTNTTLLVLVKAPVSPSKLFITSAQCSRTDSPVGVVLFVALNNLLTNGVSTYIPVPAQGTAVTFPTPIVISPTTSLFMQASTNVTSVYCNAQGYQAP